MPTAAAATTSTRTRGAASSAAMAPTATTTRRIATKSTTPATSKAAGSVRTTSSSTRAAPASSVASSSTTATTVTKSSAPIRTKTSAPSVASSRPASASKAVGSAEESSSSNVHKVQALALRSKANTAHEAGCQLYAERLFSEAIAPFKEAAELCEEAEAHYARFRDDQPEQAHARLDAEALQRKLNNIRRLDVLAACYRMSGKVALSIQTTHRALQNMPPEKVSELASASGSMGITELFASSEWSRTASIVRDVLDLVLFASSSASADSPDGPTLQDSAGQEEPFEPAAILQSLRIGSDEDSEMAKLCKAALLEHYMTTSLDANLHRSDGPRIMTSTLDACEDIYTDDRHPIRKARIILRRVEIELLKPSSQLSGSGLLQRLAEALSLLEGPSMLDAGLQRYASQYMASAYLLRSSVLQHCPSVAGDGGLDLLESAERATMLLQKVMDNAHAPPASPAPPKPLGVPSTPPRQVRASSASGSRYAPVPRPSSNDVKAKVDVGKVGKALVDDPLRLCAQIDAMTSMLAAFGHGLATLKLLRSSRRLRQLDSLRQYLPRSDYFKTCAELASLYLSFGQTTRARDVVSEAQKALQEQEQGSIVGPPGKSLTADAQVRCLLVEVELECAMGDTAAATACYDRALNIAEGLRAQKQRYRWQAGLEQFQLLERQALASQACSTLRLASHDLDGAINAGQLCCRQWYKIASLISKLSTPSSSEWSGPPPQRTSTSSDCAIPGIEDPFGPAPGANASTNSSTDGNAASSDAPASDATVQEKPSKKQPSLQHALRQLPAQALVGVYWRCGSKLVKALLNLSRLLLTRGSGHDAEAYATEAVETAEALNTSLTLSRALLQRAEARLLTSRSDDGKADLLRARDLLQEAWIPEASESARIIGEEHLRSRSAAKASESFAEGQAALEQLKTLYSDVEAITPSPVVRRTVDVKARRSTSSRAPSVGGSKPGSLLPDAQARLLIRQAQACLLDGDRAASATLLERVLAMPITADVSVHSKNALGQVALQHALRNLSKHQVLNSFTDSVISAPMISPSSKIVLATGAKAIIKALASAHASFTEAIHSGALISDVLVLREIVSAHAVVVAILHSLEVGSKASGQRGDSASTFDFGTSVTVLREYMSAISSKLAWSIGSTEEPKWLKATHASATAFVPKGMSLFAPKPDKLDRFWMSVYAEGSQASVMANDVQLPPHWSVVNIAFDKTRNALVVARQGGGHRPLVLHLPVDRMSRREGEDEFLSIDAAVQRMSALTEKINAGVQGAKDVEGREAKVRWWESRRALDGELEELMTQMETTWLGGFKSVLAEPSRAPEGDLASLREKLAGVLNHACAPSAKAGSQIKLDRMVIECLARLRPGVATDEDIEDIIHFMMDALQVGGAAIAVDEVDVDDCVIAVRTALDEFWSQQSKAGNDCARQADEDHHLFLVLDKDACAFPWESLAILRDRPVSRVPSIRFIQDRIKMAPLFSSEQHEDAASTGRYYELDKPKTFWLLNPGGDLKRTESRLTPWLTKKQKQCRWQGITGRIPIVDELPRALEENDVFTYFGHGGASQYIRSSRIRKLKRCAVAMLWGCSSGMLRDQGELDRTGTPIHYMLAGAPALVANLWDMTDLELDRICETVFCKVGMMDPQDRGVKSLVGGNAAAPDALSLRPMSLTRAVAEARRDCRLPYLSGGGCITYGVPVYFRRAA